MKDNLTQYLESAATAVVYDVNLSFSVLTPLSTHHTVHLYNTTYKLCVQGSSHMSTKPGANTLGEWFTKVLSSSTPGLDIPLTLPPVSRGGGGVTRSAHLLH